MNEQALSRSEFEEEFKPLFEKGLIKGDGILDIGVLSGESARSYFDSYIGKTILMRNNIVR